MTYVDEQTRLASRAAKIEQLLRDLHDLYDGLASRAERSGPAGFDDQPKQRKCEHRREWKRGKLCLGCDNTGWRRCAPGEQGVDPYADDLPPTTSGVKLDESIGAQRARYIAHLDASLAKIAQAQRVQWGKEAVEGRELAAVRIVTTALERRPVLKRLARALEVMRHREPLLFDRLPAPDAIAWLAGYSGLGRLQ